MTDARKLLVSSAEEFLVVFDEVMKVELANTEFTDINPTQAMLVYRLGEQEMPVGSLELVGCYNGTNVSYNLTKLVELGYVSRRLAQHDHRVKIVGNTERGRALCETIDLINDRHNRLAPPDSERTALEACAVLHRAAGLLRRIRDTASREAEAAAA